MKEKPETLQPLDKRGEASGENATLKSKIMLALLPTVTILVVLALLEAFSRQRLLFASLASSAFLIYLDPRHEANSVRTLVMSQAAAALLGSAALAAFGAGYLSAAAAMIVTISLMIWMDAMHPPFRPRSPSLFGTRRKTVWFYSASPSAAFVCSSRCKKFHCG